MKAPCIFIVAVFAMVCGCCNDAGPTSAPSTRPSSPAIEELAGIWAGTAHSVMQWAPNAPVELKLNIAADLTVTGSVGDAKLVDAKVFNNRGPLERALDISRDFRISGRLEGAILADQQIHRDSVDIVFDITSDGTAVGGLTTSGTEFGGKDSMKLAAGKMTLTRP